MTTTDTTTLILTSGRLTDAARAKAVESTGTDPGEWVYRLHRPTCDRIRNADSPREVDVERVGDYADQVLAAKPCVRCKPRGADLDTFEARAQANVNFRQEQAAAVPEPTPAQQRNANKPTRRYTREAREALAAAEQAEPVARVEGEVLGVSATTYPKVADDQPLWCAAHEEHHPARQFPVVAKGTDAERRSVECRKARDARLAEQKATGAKGRPARLPEARIQPKG